MGSDKKAIEIAFAGLVSGSSVVNLSSVVGDPYLVKYLCALNASYFGIVQHSRLSTTTTFSIAATFTPLSTYLLLLPPFRVFC